MDYDEYAWVKSSEYRENVLLSLDTKPKPPKEISDETDYYLSHVSSTLSDLEENELVECLTPDRHKGRLYAATSAGEEIIELLKE